MQQFSESERPASRNNQKENYHGKVEGLGNGQGWDLQDEKRSCSCNHQDLWFGLLGPRSWQTRRECCLVGRNRVRPCEGDRCRTWNQA